MITIQELGTSIMSDHPKPFYILGGSEYGVKDKYIDLLTKLYGHKEEYRTVADLINFLSVKHMIPVPPSLYIVRYDEAFVSCISAQLAQRIHSLKINGTVICIYEDGKQIDKLDKFLPSCTAVIEPVGCKYVEKYLHSDFPKLDDRSIQIAAKCASSYGHARTICKSMSCADPTTLAKMTEDQLVRLFGSVNTASSKDFRIAVAQRNVKLALNLLAKYETNLDDLNEVIYTILQTMIDLEKILTSKYSDSDIKDYAKYWKVQDIYYMFMQAYSQLDLLRSNTSSDIQASLVYLFSLFSFRDIPSVEVMNEG